MLVNQRLLFPSRSTNRLRQNTVGEELRGRRNGKSRTPRIGVELCPLLRLVMLSDSDGLVVIGRIEFGVIGAPGRGLEDT
jgi:hypothetical protein